MNPASVIVTLLRERSIDFNCEFLISSRDWYKIHGEVKLVVT